MKNFIVHDRENGRIVRLGYCADDDFLLQAGEGEIVVEGTADDAKQCVIDGQVVDRPPMPYFLDRDSVPIGEVVTFSSLPVGVEINVDGDIVVVNDRILALTFDTTGDYRVRLSLFPYLDKEVMITCN